MHGITPAWRRATLLLFLLGGPLGTCRSYKQFSSVRERDVPAVGAGRAVFGLKAFENDFRPFRKREFGKTATDEHIRGAGFEHPLRRGPILVLHVDVNPAMGIDHIDLGYDASQLDRLIRVEFGREGMMGRQRKDRNHQYSGRGG